MHGVFGKQPPLLAEDALTALEFAWHILMTGRTLTLSVMRRLFSICCLSRINRLFGSASRAEALPGIRILAL